MAWHYFNMHIVGINGRGNANKYSAKRIFWRCGTDKCIFNNNIYRDIVIMDEKIFAKTPIQLTLIDTISITGRKT